VCWSLTFKPSVLLFGLTGLADGALGYCRRRHHGLSIAVDRAQHTETKDTQTCASARSAASVAPNWPASVPLLLPRRLVF
jgi:hypothetical protein